MALLETLQGPDACPEVFLFLLIFHDLLMFFCVFPLNFEWYFMLFYHLFCEVVCIFLAPACDKTLIRATEEELDGWMDGWMDGWDGWDGWMMDE